MFFRFAIILPVAAEEAVMKVIVEGAIVLERAVEVWLIILLFASIALNYILLRAWEKERRK